MLSTAIQPGAEHWLGVVKLTPHAEMLATLAAEKENHTRLCTVRTLGGKFRGLGQGGQGPIAAGTEHETTMGKRLTADLQGPGHIGDRDLGLILQMPSEILRRPIEGR